MTNGILETLQARLPLQNAEHIRDARFKPAAVLVLLSADAHDPKVILTTRATHIANFKGEVCFPGGSWEAADPDLTATALRETHEEIGVAPNLVRVLGPLHQTLIPRNNFLISPFLGTLLGSCEFKPNPHEVDELLQVPLSWLLDPANRRLEPSRGYAYPLGLPSQLLPNYSYGYGKHRVLGATARILTGVLMLLEESVRKEEAWKNTSPTLRQ